MYFQIQILYSNTESFLFAFVPIVIFNGDENKGMMKNDGVLKIRDVNTFNFRMPVNISPANKVVGNVKCIRKKTQTIVILVPDSKSVKKKNILM